MAPQWSRTPQSKMAAREQAAAGDQAAARADQDLGGLEDLVRAVQGLASKQDDPEARRIRTCREKTISAISRCDGSSMPAVRIWIREIEANISDFNVPHLWEAIKFTTGGPLGISLRELVTAQVTSGVQADQILWPVFKKHVEQTYLTADEPSFLRAQLEALNQGSMDIITYTHKFRDLANQAYPLPRNSDVDRLLCDAILKGLDNSNSRRSIYEKLYSGNEETLQSAINVIYLHVKILSKSGGINQSQISTVSPTQSKPSKLETNPDEKLQKQIEQSKYNNIGASSQYTFVNIEISPFQSKQNQNL